jgi:hypothetical protein
MTRREPPPAPPEDPDYCTVVTLGAPVKCAACERWLHRGDVVVMDRWGFNCVTCVGEGT